MQVGGSFHCGLHKVLLAYTCYSSKDCFVSGLVDIGRQLVVEHTVVVVDHTVVVVVAVAAAAAVGYIVVHYFAVVLKVAIPRVFVGVVLQALVEKLVPWPEVEH